MIDLIVDAQRIRLLLDTKEDISTDGVSMCPVDGIEFLLSLMPNVQGSYWATNYSSPQESWLQNFGKRAMQLQESMVKKGISIRRVFIINSDKEFESILPLMRQQRDMGIDVRYIRRVKIERATLGDEIRAKLGTLDFILIDQRYLFRVLLNRQRYWKGAEITKSRELFAYARKVYEQIWADASSLQGQ